MSSPTWSDEAGDSDTFCRDEVGNNFNTDTEDTRLTETAAQLARPETVTKSQYDPE